MKKFFGYSFYVLCCSVIILILLEIGVRLWGYSEHYIYGPIYMPFPASNDIPYVYKPNMKEQKRVVLLFLIQIVLVYGLLSLG